jgi:hypothetical protein
MAQEKGHGGSRPHREVCLGLVLAVASGACHSYIPGGARGAVVHPLLVFPRFLARLELVHRIRFMRVPPW